MKQPTHRISGSGSQRQRKSVAQILRASDEQFAKDEESMVVVKLLLGSGVKAQS